MTSEEAIVLEIIKWALNSQLPTPPIETLPEDLLIERAVHHRMIGPVLARLDTARPAWCPPRVRTQLRIRQHRAKQTT